MLLQLYVLGPAFGLPSIDAECSAAIAMMRLKFGDEQDKWTITPSHTATETLPLLVDGAITLSGFSNICHHLRSQEEDADAVATTALIQARAPVLIAAYLYLSYENYSTTTRPAFNPILPLYARFGIPPALRSAAKENTSQLGIGSLDIETLDDKHESSNQNLGSAESTFEASAKDCASLLLPRAKTVRSLLAQRPEKMAAFKLQNLADALLEPLHELLGERTYFAGDDNPSEVDCLAYAYLGLMLKPAVPQSWLSKIIRERYGGLVSYFQRVEDHLELGTEFGIKSRLSWKSPASVNFGDAMTDVTAMLVKHSSLLKASAVATEDDLQASVWSRHLPAILVAAGSTLVAGASWALLPLISAPHGDATQIFGGQAVPDFSHVSDALAGLSFSLPQETGLHVTSDDEPPARFGIEIES